MDIEPFKILNSSITNGDDDVANSNEIDNIHELFQENTRNILNINKDEEIVLSEVEKRSIQIALKKPKDLTAEEKIFLNDWLHLLDHMARRQDIPKAIEKKVKDIQVGDLLILHDNENPNVEDLVVMANSEVNENYFRGIPVVFDENLASNVSSVIEPEDNKTNSQLKDWSFALLDEAESEFHISQIKDNGWLQKVTSISSHGWHSSYNKKRGRKIRNEFDRRAPYRARVFDLVHYYSNLDPKGIKKKIELNSIKQTQPQLTG